jgi:FkbM family methyltransferase|tara:strand:- start:26 stop:928 length:903 start_codon:yes stop_codon:yes gene_type:complete
MKTLDKVINYGIIKTIKIIRDRFFDYISKKILKTVNKFGLYSINQYINPYIIEKKLEGEEFLLSIEDKDAKLWYDLSGRDNDWHELGFIKNELLKKGDEFIEVGSHHGCTTILLSRWVGETGRGYAFEPGVSNFKILEKNLKLNSIINVKCLNNVVGDDRKKVSFKENKDYSMSSSVSNDTSFHGDLIDQITLDEFSKVYPNLIKIDVQGYVDQVLNGMSRILKESGSNFAIEIDPVSVINSCGGNLSNIFKNLELPSYQYYAQFDTNKPPQKILYSEILRTWEKVNNCSEDLHLFLKKT